MAKVSWAIAIRLWWWWAWRSVLLSFAAGFVAGFVMGFVMGLLGISNQVISIAAAAAGGVLGFIISIALFRAMLGKEFKDFRVVIEEKNPG